MNTTTSVGAAEKTNVGHQFLESSYRGDSAQQDDKRDTAGGGVSMKVDVLEPGLLEQHV